MVGFEPGVRGLASVGGGLGLGMVFLAEMGICSRGIVQFGFLCMRKWSRLSRVFPDESNWSEVEPG